ncbi:nuclease-related domain-containing protein [Leifsonia sp. NPDC058194]|uniref:nuclease-related domain-containing protein n=1 Tax=Leifsonia sp. NPDC058194 TaxID=3346374 RepID=UPI0036D9E8AE
MGDERAAPAPTPRVDFAGIMALSSRPAGYAVALKCLQVQADAVDVDPALRSGAREILHPDAESWYQGALGEIAVGALLEALGPGWFVRHAVPIGAGTKDVDHLVIGPGGVFAINTKHHSGAAIWVGDHVLRVNNANTHHLASAHRDGADVARRLAAKAGFPVPVTPVVAILNARTVKDGRSASSRSVAVLPASSLVGWLKSQRSLLPPAKTELIMLAAEEPGTWHSDPRAADTLCVMQRFERLVARVGAPRSPVASAARAGTGSTSPRSSRQRGDRGTNVGARRSSTRLKEGSTLPRLLGLWLTTAAAIGAILIIRDLAAQPCTGPAACMLPALYSAWKPLLIVAGIALIGRAVLLTFRGQGGSSRSRRR